MQTTGHNSCCWLQVLKFWKVLKCNFLNSELKRIAFYVATIHNFVYYDSEENGIQKEVHFVNVYSFQHYMHPIYVHYCKVNQHESYQALLNCCSISSHQRNINCNNEN